jgi:hypothetical protein
MWKEMDDRENVNEMNEANFSSVFEVQSIFETRFIRLRMIGRDWHGNQCLHIRAFEVFGGFRILDSMALH